MRIAKQNDGVGATEPKHRGVGRAVVALALATMAVHAEDLTRRVDCDALAFVAVAGAAADAPANGDTAGPR